MEPAENVLAFKMTSARAKQLLAKIAEHSTNVIFTRHALERMRKRKITPSQVLGCLRKGKITEVPCLDHYGCWKLTIERYVSGENIGCAVSIDCSERKTIVITAFWVKP